MKRTAVLILALMLVTAACGDDDDTGATVPDAGTVCAPGQVDGDLDLYNWSDYIDPDLIPAFEAEFGVSVTETFFDSNEAMLAQIQAGGAAYDLIVPSDYMVGIMSEEGLLYPLQRDAIPNYDNIDSAFRGLPFDPDGQWSVPYQWGTTGLGVAYEAVGEDFDPSWALVFEPDPSYSGKISLLNDPRETMGAALKYLGYSVNSTSQAELDEAVELIRSIKGDLAKFDSDQFEDDLVSGETLVAHGYSGDFFAAFDEADGWEDFAYVIPKEGAVAWVDNMAIPVTADAVCTAHAFIDFILDAENGAALTNYVFFASPNAAAEPFIDPEILEDEAIYPPDEVFERLEFIADTGDFELNYTDAFTAVKN
jgi:spermidine/putrescine-binding protein